MEPTMTNPTASSTRQLGKLVILGILGLGIGVFFYFDLDRYVSLEALKANRDHLLEFTNANFTTAVVLYVAVYVLQTAFSLPGGAIMTLAGGFLFGSILGTIFVNVGATTGATLAFLAARYILRDWVEQKFGKRIEPIQAGFAQNAFSYLLTLRLIPAFPFFLVNLVSGLTRIPLGTYIIGTSVGIIPGSFVYAFAGRQLGSINSLAEIASLPVLLAFTFLGVLALVPILHRKFVKKETS
ncbi:MAG: TVP38/TMEM64 family protein [Nitrospira sp. SB0675_bin_23]|nr:TVP38/TMEM64 family protein [Nitrospira sp. SB0675_bin_23]